LVLLSPDVRPTGFPDGGTKLAFLRGAVDAPDDFPSDVLEALRAPRSQHDGPSLMVTSAGLDETEFATDRGRRRLPAWRVLIAGIRGAIWVLDPALRPRTWRPDGDGRRWHGATAEVDTDGHTVTMRFTGTPRVYGDYPDAEVLEAGSAIALMPVSVDIGPPRPRRLFAEQREVTVMLTRSLGSRVLLDGTGSPVMVTSRS